MPPTPNTPKRRAALAALLLALLVSPVGAASPRAESGRHGMVVGPERHAVEVGRDLLQQGGNAVDAAVGVALALAVTYPQAGNLGGGGFLLYRDPEGAYHALDFRETAPAALRAGAFLDEDGRPVPGLSLDSGLAVGVPGSVAGLAEVHRRFGRLPWKALCKPAIRLAERGFRLTPRDAADYAASGKRLARNAAARAVFQRNGAWYTAGERLVQKDLAATLRRVAAEGSDGFYRGPVARAIAEAVQAAGGVMTVDDLAAYRPVEREPVVGSYRGHRVVSFPPPSSGGVLLIQMLGMLERYDLGTSGPLSSLTVHRMAEVERRAYADRSRWLGDPGFHDNPLAGLTAPEYVAERASTIRDDRATPSTEIAPGRPSRPESDETLHFSVADREGGAVSCTTTLNARFGSGIVADRSGVLLNNEIDDFALAPGTPNEYGLLGGEANSVAAGKRPLSSMTPTIIEQRGGGKRPLLVLGSPGGAKIITSVLQVVVNVIDHGMPLQEAVDSPRFHHQWSPDEIQFEERGLVVDVLHALQTRGHRVAASPKRFGNVNAIGLAENGGWTGAADPRRQGTAAGY
jgi:gamma-glutamyltranspeptidase/glutathione hydrolase